MEISVPKLSLVLLVGASGSGKSTFAKKLFSQYEVVSSDECRGIVSNDVNDLIATTEAFDLLYHMVRIRLTKGLLTVVDATNVRREDRKQLIEIAREYHALPVAIALDLPQKVCEERNEKREDRTIPVQAIRRQRQLLRKGLRGLKREGFRKIYVFSSEEEIDQIEEVKREKLYNDKKEITGPFDIIGDIHGCYDETLTLLEKLGYVVEQEANEELFGIKVSHPENRQVIFLGDLVDRGPNSPAVLRLAMSMVKSGSAWCVPGNHDVKLNKKLSGKNVRVQHGLEKTLEQLEGESEEFLNQVREFIYGLISHYIFDDGQLVVSHAGLKESMIGRASGAVRSFCLYGETTGEIDEFGLPVRHNWASEYRGKTMVVYGHTPVPEAEWLNNTIDIDTGCVFGGKLTALRYPEKELVSVDAKEIYSEPVRPLQTQKSSQGTAQQEHDDVLDIADFLGKKIVSTRLNPAITIREENAISAIETMSRFTVDPKWLIYLPPTMSPSETSAEEGYLEYPTEAIYYFRKKGVKKLICEEKHMGSRAVIVICKNEEAAKERFGVTQGGIGVCYTRTGRPFFKDEELEKAFLLRVNQALSKANFWERLNTSWVCLDTELMPWSMKAQALLKNQYASVGAAAENAILVVEKVLQQAVKRGLEDATSNLSQVLKRKEAISQFRKAYRNYCWEVQSLEDFRLAPFHVLATEEGVHVNKSHEWHMNEISSLYAADSSLFYPTAYKIIDTDDETQIQEATNWWLELTGKGGEGMVVKPFEFMTKDAKGILQPAVKCRGKEYLRIIYGPEYDFPENLKRLKKRGLSRKRSLALREFALGVESLERFVRKVPLRKVHECVFGVLALESEETDPRL